MADTTTFDSEVRAALFRFFVENERPPVAAEIAGDLAARPIEVEQSFQRLHDAHTIVLAPGSPYVWMAHPLSALPTPYRAEIEGKAYFGNCIWDAVGIVAMLGGTGRVYARCGDCGEQLDLPIDDGQIPATDYVVHYAIAAAHWWDDIGFN